MHVRGDAIVTRKRACGQVIGGLAEGPPFHGPGAGACLHFKAAVVLERAFISKRAWSLSCACAFNNAFAKGLHASLVITAGLVITYSVLASGT